MPQGISAVRPTNGLYLYLYLYLLLLQGTLVVPLFQFLNSVAAHNGLLLRRRCVVVGSKSQYLNQITFAIVNKASNVFINVTLRRLRATIVAIEKQ